MILLLTEIGLNGTYNEILVVYYIRIKRCV